MVTQSPEYDWVFLNNSWICLNMSKCAWICLNLPEWLCFAFPYSESLSIWTCDYLFQSLHQTGRCSLKEHEAIFWRDKVWFFYIEPGSTYYAFCYRLNSFIRFQISCYLLGAMNLDILGQRSEAPLTCITFYIIIFGSDILFRYIK